MYSCFTVPSASQASAGQQPVNGSYSVTPNCIAPLNYGAGRSNPHHRHGPKASNARQRHERRDSNPRPPSQRSDGALPLSYPGPTFCPPENIRFRVALAGIVCRISEVPERYTTGRKLNLLRCGTGAYSVVFKQEVTVSFT